MTAPPADPARRNGARKKTTVDIIPMIQGTGVIADPRRRKREKSTERQLLSGRVEATLNFAWLYIFIMIFFHIFGSFRTRRQ
ncbi:hypothetical protein ACIQTU_08595 [Brevundimonas sp. NPDC090276]|uniref:hypothetical protein n=1 Tax=Brevundimonas sp. NPDC090276 TaxID=3363956 RepID=UPI00383A9DA3